MTDSSNNKKDILLMEMQYETQLGTLKSVEKDCFHILEAIRRLKDGTWNLTHEDADWVDFLLPQIKSALQDHIEYEIKCVFPGLPQDLVKEHSHEHEKISTLLWALNYSIQIKDSDRFHTLLDLLASVIEQHHRDFGCYLPNVDKCNDDCPSARIVSRAKRSSLEIL